MCVQTDRQPDTQTNKYVIFPGSLSIGKCTISIMIFEIFNVFTAIII